MHKLVRGAIAGTIATIPMTLIMIGLFRKLPSEQRYPLPPRLLIENIAGRATRLHMENDAALTHATLAAHFAYGAATGAVYPYLESHRGPNTVTGVGYGLGIWAASYLGWIPAARLLDPATRHPARRNALMLAAHVVWGAALARVSAALRGSITRSAEEKRTRLESPSPERILQGEFPFSRHKTPDSSRLHRHA